MRSWFSSVKKALGHQPPSGILGEAKGHQSFRKDLKSILPHTYDHWKTGSAGAVFLLLASGLAFPQPMIFRFLVDNVLINRQMRLIIPVLLLWAVVIMVENLSNQFQEFFFTQFQQEVTIDIQKKVLERTISLPKTFFDSVKSGYLVSRLRNDVQWIQWFFSGTLVQFAAQLCKFVGSVAFLFYLEWRIALPVILTVPITWLIASYLSAKTYILSHHAMESHAEVSGNFQECFSNVPLIKGFTREIDTIGKLIQGLRQIHSIALEQQSLNGLIQLSINAVPGFAKLLVMGFGSYLVVKDTWTLGSLLAFIAYLDYVYAPAKFLASSQHQFQRSRAALQRVVSLLHMIPEVNIDSGEIMARPVKRVEFRGVVFSYNRQKIVLDGVSFSANAGQKVTILGPSGSGKTTFISLLLRFYQPTEGEILFNGRPARELETRSIRASFGYVPQENLLFSGTIIENLIYGNSAATHEQVERAARTAGIQDFIVSLRDGYQTKVGERGVTLSEGQKQRLSIARALVPDPDILILDEPTSALDLPTAHEILTSLSRSAANKILFIVTHRPDAMEESDLLIELDAGGRVKVRESGKIV